MEKNKMGIYDINIDKYEGRLQTNLATMLEMIKQLNYDFYNLQGVDKNENNAIAFSKGYMDIIGKLQVEINAIIKVFGIEKESYLEIYDRHSNYKNLEELVYGIHIAYKTKDFQFFQSNGYDCDEESIWAYVQGCNNALSMLQGDLEVSQYIFNRYKNK